MRRGNCYVTCEALYHLLNDAIKRNGGPRRFWKPETVRHEGDVHWYLVAPLLNNMVLDPTASQFKTPVPYHKGRGRGFLTKKPSKRARALMKTLVWQEIR
jgi:hypothetical protein